MPLPDEFVAEINQAIENTVVETKQEESKVVDERSVVESSGATEASAKTTEQDREGAEIKEGGDGRGTGDGGSEPKQPEPPAISDFALTKAVYAGLNIEDARNFPSDDALLRVIESVESAKQVAKKPEETQEEDPFAALPKLDPDAYEPEVVQTFEKLTDIVRQQHETIKSLQTHQNESSQSNYQAAANEIESWFNGQVKNLGDEFHETLGVGDYGALPKGSSQLAKRDELASQMAVLVSGYQASGRPMPAREKLFDAAVRVVLGDELSKIRESKLSKELEKRSNQHIARVGGKKASPANSVSPLDEVAQILDSKFFSKGR